MPSILPPLGPLRGGTIELRFTSTSEQDTVGLFSKPKNLVPSEAEREEGRRTPKRSELVQSQVRPLVPNDRKEARRIAREQMAVEREKQRLGFERGEEKYLPPRDKGEVRRYVRDYVDARLSIASLMIPAMIIVLILTFINDPEIRIIANVGLYSFVAVAILDCVLLSFLVNRRVKKKFGEGNTRGNGWYASMRAAQLPFMRMPKPQAKLFQFPE